MINNTTETKRSGPVHTYNPNGISIIKFSKLIILPMSKQIDAINCKILTFFMKQPPFFFIFECC